MVDYVSADTDHLEAFVTLGRAYASNLRHIGEHLGRLRSMVAREIGPSPVPSSEPNLVELLDWVVTNNEYVEAVHGSLKLFDFDADPQVTVPGSIVEMGLAESGFTSAAIPDGRAAVARLASRVQGEGLDPDGDVQEAADSYRQIAEAIDNGNDSGMSNGELNRVQSELNGLETESQQAIFELLTDEQLDVLFHNVHSSGAWSNDWDDRERGEFYDIVYDLDQAAIDRLAPHSPWVQAGSPSRASAEALGTADDNIGDGTSFAMSVGEMNSVAAAIDGLSGSDLQYVLDNLSDDQLAVLIHNAHPTGFWSNDWSDDQRSSFFDDFNGYLDLLVAANTYEAPPGEFPSAPEADLLVRSLLPPDYIAVPVANGQQASGNLAIVDEANFAFAWGRSNGEPVPDTLNGFVDSDGRQWVRASRANYGTPVHEALHNYSDDALRQLAWDLNEGVTEYFTLHITDQLDDPATTIDEAAEIAGDRRNIYSDSYDFVDQLAGAVGEDVIAAAYFEGDIDRLRTEYIAATGRTEDDWDSMIEHVQNEAWTDANDLIRPTTP